MYICIHIYNTYTYIYIYKHMYIYFKIYIYLYVQIYTRTHAHTRTYTHALTRTHTHINRTIMWIYAASARSELWLPAVAVVILEWLTFVSTQIMASKDAGRCDLYGVATIRRLLKVIGLFCKRALQKRIYSVKETYNFKEPTSRSHPICVLMGI